MPVNCASSDLLRVFVVMMCLFRFKCPPWRGRERQQEQSHRRRGVTGNRGINEGQPVGNHRLSWLWTAPQSDCDGVVETWLCVLRRTGTVSDASRTGRIPLKNTRTFLPPTVVIRSGC